MSTQLSVDSSAITRSLAPGPTGMPGTEAAEEGRTPSGRQERSGRTPTLSMRLPLGVTYFATVTNTAEPSDSSYTDWILPLPKVGSARG